MNGIDRAVLANCDRPGGQVVVNPRAGLASFIDEDSQPIVTTSLQRQAPILAPSR